MAIWPTELPGPMRSSVNIVFGSNTVRRQLQSGRTEVRRFGDGAPDQVQTTFRFKNAHVEQFKGFFAWSINLGVDWFTADWLPLIGYSGHQARILGYPQRKSKGLIYSDYSVTLLIQKTEWCASGSDWPSGGW